MTTFCSQIYAPPIAFLYRNSKTCGWNPGPSEVKRSFARDSNQQGSQAPVGTVLIPVPIEVLVPARTEVRKWLLLLAYRSFLLCDHNSLANTIFEMCLVLCRGSYISLHLNTAQEPGCCCVYVHMPVSINTSTHTAICCYYNVIQDIKYICYSL